MDTLNTYISDPESDDSDNASEMSLSRSQEADANCEQVNMDMSEDSGTDGDNKVVKDNSQIQNERKLRHSSRNSSRSSSDGEASKKSSNKEFESNNNGHRSSVSASMSDSSPNRKRKSIEHDRKRESEEKTNSNRDKRSSDKCDRRKDVDRKHDRRGDEHRKKSEGGDDKKHKDDRRRSDRDRKEDSRRSEYRSSRSERKHSRRSRSRSRSHHRSSRSSRRSRSRSRSPHHKSRHDERKHYSRRSPYRSSGRSRSRHRSPYMRSLEKKSTAKLQVLEKLGIELKIPPVTTSSCIPFVTANGLISSGGVPLTPQLLLQKQMEEQVEKVKSETGIELPPYYNPVSVNPSKYAEQIQKRRLLWGNKQKSETESTAAPVAAAPTVPISVENKDPGTIWQGATFGGDQDGKMTAKFKRLMGIKGDQGAPVPPAGESDIIKKQEEMFNSMESQYEVARLATHSHRGLGLGFGTFQPR